MLYAQPFSTSAWIQMIWDRRSDTACVIRQSYQTQSYLASTVLGLLGLPSAEGLKFIVGLRVLWMKSPLRTPAWPSVLFGMIRVIVGELSTRCALATVTIWRKVA